METTDADKLRNTQYTVRCLGRLGAFTTGDSDRSFLPYFSAWPAAFYIQLDKSPEMAVIRFRLTHDEIFAEYLDLDPRPLSITFNGMRDCAYKIACVLGRIE